MTDAKTHEPPSAVHAALNSDITAILIAPATSAWLQAALSAALDRDCVDAANDAEILADLLRRRCDAILEAR